MENLYIDTDAKEKIELVKMEADRNGSPYYIGKRQFPGTYEFEHGISFMAFVSEEGTEELQISPLDPSRVTTNNNETRLNNGKIYINMHPMIDKNRNVYYVGEAIGPVKISLLEGVFFTLFVSRQGYEELQISRLNHKAKRDPAQVSIETKTYKSNI
jgi:hypothetical protein